MENELGWGSDKSSENRFAVHGICHVPHPSSFSHERRKKDTHSLNERTSECRVQAEAKGNVRVRRCIINIFEARCRVGLVTTCIHVLGLVYEWDRRDYVGLCGRRMVIYEFWEMLVDYAISNQHRLWKFEEMGWDMFLRKHKRSYCALPHNYNLVGCWGGATLSKNGAERYAGMLVCKRKSKCIWCRNNNNLSAFFKIKNQRQLESFYRSFSVHAIWSNASVIAHD